MSGIAGIVGSNRASRAAVQAMIAAMPHRARDGSASWEGEGVALGHAWLSTTGERAGGPSHLAAAGLTVTADCRLDNREELVAALQLRGDDPTDAELIGHAYLHWGADCAQRLEGDFAFALWDATERRLFCARDRFGVKPFYYHSGNGWLALASEIGPIASLEGVGRQVNEAHVGALLVGLADNMEITSHRSVLRLPPAHTLCFSNGGVVLRSYWRLEPLGRMPRGDWAEEFRHLFERAVAARMRGETGLAAMLSGGLDSSSIAVTARRLLSPPGDGRLRTYSMVFEPKATADERQWIDAVLARGGFDPRFVPVESYRPFGEFHQILAEQEGAFLAPGLPMVRRMLRAAREDGVRVILDGHGGDEVVSHGHGRLIELAGKGRWLKLWREVHGVANLHGWHAGKVYLPLLMRHGPAWPLVKWAVRAARRARRLGSRTKERAQDIRSLVRSGLAEQHDLAARLRRARPPAWELQTEAAHHHFNLSGGQVPHAFEVLDKATARFGLEPRYPFFDRRLVEFCLSLPSEAKLEKGWTRFVLRQAMDGLLPPAVQWRRDKADFKHVLSGAMIGHHHDLIEDVLGAGGQRVEPYVDLDVVKASYQRMRGDPTGAHMNDIQNVWRTVALSAWLQGFERAGGTV